MSDAKTNRAAANTTGKWDQIRTLEMAATHLQRSGQLLDAQAELLRIYEQHRWETGLTRKLLVTMYRAHHLMREHRDQLLAVWR